MKPAPYLIRCQKCNRPLIERMSNGFLRFQYGQPWRKGVDGTWESVGAWIPVEVLVHGSVKIKCFRKECQEWNIVNYLPNDNDFTNQSTLKNNRETEPPAYFRVAPKKEVA